MSTSSNTLTIPGTDDYPGSHRSAFQNGSQHVSETPRLGNYQQQRYFEAGHLSSHTNVHSQIDTRNLGSFNGYTAAENSLPINRVSASENFPRYETLSTATNPQFMVSTSSCMPMDQMPMNQHMPSVSGNFMAHHMPYTKRTLMQHPEVSTCTSWNQPVSPVVPQPEEYAYQNQNANPMLYNPGTMVPHRMQPASSASTTNDETKKPSASYIQLIADALLASVQGVLVLRDICESIMNKYPYYRNCNPKWKVCIRYTLSVNNCFNMVRASNMGRGHLWSSLEYFRKGKYNRREVNKLVQQWHNNNRSDNTTDREPTSSQMAMGEQSADTNRDDSTSSTTMTAAAASPQQQNASATQH